MTRYIITGAAGHLGSTIIRILLAEMQSVRELLLPTEQPIISGVEYVRGDVLDSMSLRPLFQRKSDERLVVIHTAGIINAAGEMNHRLYSVNVTGTKNILKLCKEYCVDKLVYVSSVHAIPESSKFTVQTEIHTFDPKLVVGGYAKTKAEATQAVLNAAEDGLPAVVVHPSGIIGPYDKGNNHLVQLMLDYIKGRLPVCVRGGYDFVDVRDVGNGCILAAKYGGRGECYILSGAYHEIKEILDLTATLCGKRSVPILPMPLVRCAEPIIRFLAKHQGRRALYTRYSLDTLCSRTRFSSQKAKSELGYTVRDIETTVQDTVQWLTANT